MAELDPQIDELQKRLDDLVKTQISFQTEITAIRKALAELRGPTEPVSQTTPPYEPPKAPESSRPLPPTPQAPPVWPQTPPITQKLPPEPKPTSYSTDYQRSETYTPPPKPEPKPRFYSAYVASARADLEKFIGENLISLIGIIILMLGVGIGAKYAIDNGWISPLMRIIFGYVIGIGLLGFAIKLKPKYLNFSAVLLSGGMGILYFVTYFAYAAYFLIPQTAAFVLMAIFTIFTVAAALIYSRQVIAHIGLVGAYAVPFLLSNNSGQYTFLFTYVAIINLGILAVSVIKYWKPLFYNASCFTWLIFAVWFSTKYSSAEHLYLALTFLAIFFAIFYAAKITHALLHSEADDTENLMATVVTTVIFYAFTFAISDLRAGVFEYTVLFSYLAVASLAILITSFRCYGRKYWMALFYTASGFTWLTLMVWLRNKYIWTDHLYLVLTFLAIFFVIFYGAKIAQGMLDPESNDLEILISTIVTTMIFYAFLFAISDLRAGVFEYSVIFSYLAIAALAILLTSFRYYGRILVLVSYPFTWLIYGAWFTTKFDTNEHFTLAAVFAGVFFVVFYGATLTYRLLTDEIGMVENAGLVLTNSFVFYGFGYAILDSRENLQPFEGLFTATHGIFHSIVAQLVNRFKQSAADVVQVLAVLIITFTTIAIPVQFEGNHVTLIWAVEAAVLFFFGRARGVRLFEYFSYPLMALATGSLFIEWVALYGERTSYISEYNRQPIANGDFVTALVFVAAFAVIYVINRDKEHDAAIDDELILPLGLIVGAIGLIALYNTFRIEISNYYHLQTVYEAATNVTRSLTEFVQPDGDFARFNIVWQLNYTMFFLAVLGAVNLRWARSRILAFTNVLLAIFTFFLFSTVGMGLLYELRFGNGWMNRPIRYVSYAFAAGLMFVLYRYSRSDLLSKGEPPNFSTYAFDAVVHLTALIALSCELINLMGQFHIADSTKLGLSILWGVYALFLIVIGIAKSKKHLRIAAIVLLAITLVKLFFYDIADLPTIPKTILFVSLGLLMLLVSFLYNKYKVFIFGEAAKEGD